MKQKEQIETLVGPINRLHQFQKKNNILGKNKAWPKQVLQGLIIKQLPLKIKMGSAWN